MPPPLQYFRLRSHWVSITAPSVDVAAEVLALPEWLVYTYFYCFVLHETKKHVFRRPPFLPSSTQVDLLCVHCGIHLFPSGPGAWLPSVSSFLSSHGVVYYPAAVEPLVCVLRINRVFARVRAPNEKTRNAKRLRTISIRS